MDGNRFAIGKSVPGIIIGKGGERVKTIREESGANVSIGESQPNEAQERVMEIKGDAAKTAVAVFMITQEILKHNEASPDRAVSADLRMLVHKGYAGAILGKGGATITQIMTQSGAKVRLSNDPMPGSTDKICSVVGSPVQIQAACELLLNKMEQHPLREGTPTVHYLSGPAAALPGSGGAPGGGGFGGPPQGMGGMGGQQAQNPMAAYAAAGYQMDPAMAAYYGYGAYPTQAFGGQGQGFSQPQPSAAASDSVPAQHVIHVPAMCGGAIIGKGGQGVTGIKQASGCNVSVGDSSGGEAGTRDITVRGPKDALASALNMVMRAAEVGAPPQQMLQQMSMPASCTGAVIGKGGANIRDMKTQSACNISLAEPTAEDPETRVVTMTGSPIGLQIAAYLVQAACEKEQSKPANTKMQGMQGGEQSMEQVSIPSTSFRNVVGPKGATINSIKHQSGCSISIAEASPEAPGSRVVTIRGPSVGIPTAVMLINQYLQA